MHYWNIRGESVHWCNLNLYIATMCRQALLHLKCSQVLLQKKSWLLLHENHFTLNKICTIKLQWKDFFRSLNLVECFYDFAVSHNIKTKFKSSVIRWFMLNYISRKKLTKLISAIRRKTYWSGKLLIFNLRKFSSHHKFIPTQGWYQPKWWCKISVRQRKIS